MTNPHKTTAELMPEIEYSAYHREGNTLIMLKHDRVNEEDSHYITGNIGIISRLIVKELKGVIALNQTAKTPSHIKKTVALQGIIAEEEIKRAINAVYDRVKETTKQALQVLEENPDATRTAWKKNNEKRRANLDQITRSSTPSETLLDHKIPDNVTKFPDRRAA